jgi:hypothetical protein
MQSTFVPIGLSSISDDYFRGIKGEIIQEKLLLVSIFFLIIGFLLMAFDKDDNPIGKFSIERNGRLMSCSNGTNVRFNYLIKFYNFDGEICFCTECCYPFDE